MPSPVFDGVIAQAQEALRLARPTLAISHLTPLLVTHLSLPQQAHAHALLAQAYELTSQWDEVAVLLRRYEDRQHTAELPLALQSLLCRCLAALHTEQGTWPQALHFARLALHLAELDDHASDQGEAHQALGKAYRLLGQPAFARQHFQTALNLHQTLGARVLMAKSYFGLGVVAGSSSEYALARQALDRALTLVSEADDPLLYGLLCSMQVSTLALEETAPLAEREQWFVRAKAAFEQVDHRRFLARLLGNWGDQLLRVGRWQESERLLQQALSLSQALQDRRSLANALDSLAELQARQGNYDISQSYLGEALSWVEGRDYFVELQVRLSIARLHWQQGHVALARTTLAQVVTRAGEAEAKQWQLAAQLYLAEMALAEGQETTAAELLQSCQADVERLRSLGLLGHLRLLEGRLAFARQQFVAAREALEQAGTIFDISGQRWWLGRAQFALAEMLAQTDQPAAARATLQEAERNFQAVAAHPYLQQLQQWRRRHLRPTLTQASPSPAAPPLPLPESEGVGRLLRAVGFREVLLREFLVLLQAELPTHQITFSERAETGAQRILLTSTTRPAASSPATFRLEPWQAVPLEVAITPAPTLTPKIGNLLQAAQIGLEACAARERVAFTTAAEQQAEHLERRLPGLQYQSQAMRKLAADIHQIQGSEVTVLLLGESGTGKELVARALHALSHRRERPFVPFNCANLSAELLASELFGHRKGAFTGATHASRGVIRAAEHGTLFLDEIGELPLEVQPKLLRFLQDKEIHPLGAGTPEKVNVRVIAATNRSLEELVKAGRFREDLYFRLHVIPLQVPPLRARREEIPLLARHFLTQYGAAARKPALELCPEALDALMVYDWPGNVRQLENEMQRLVAFAKPGQRIPVAALSAAIHSVPAHGHQKNGWGSHGTPSPSHSLKAILEKVERATLEDMLTRCDGNISQAATELELSRGGLYAKLERYGIALPNA